MEGNNENLEENTNKKLSRKNRLFGVRLEDFNELKDVTNLNIGNISVLKGDIVKLHENMTKLAKYVSKSKVSGTNVVDVAPRKSILDNLEDCNLDDVMVCKIPVQDIKFCNCDADALIKLLKNAGIKHTGLIPLDLHDADDVSSDDKSLNTFIEEIDKDAKPVVGVNPSGHGDNIDLVEMDNNDS